MADRADPGRLTREDKRAALGLTQVDLDTAARRTAVALTRESSGLYVEHIAERLSEAFACAVFEADLPSPEEWQETAMEDFMCEWFERREDAA